MLLASCLLSEFMSSMVAIKCEDGTKCTQAFYTEDTRDGGQKDENLKSGKVQNYILQINIVMCTIILPIFQPSTKTMVFKTCILKKAYPSMKT